MANLNEYGGFVRADAELAESDIHAFLEQNESKELLRFVTVGSVDDGKSTLIGRLLHDSKGVYDDQLKDATKTSETGEQAIDFARLTDGLRAEREQGITIDVAYRYFSTPSRKFIIADTPGHVQYTRNMATGASTADVALILIDARLGVLVQSRRHATIASLLGIPHLLVCVNKMDLVDYGEQRYEQIVADFRAVIDNLSFSSVSFVPVSALMGVNVVEQATERMPWYTGPTVLGFLEQVPIDTSVNHANFRFPVQYVLRPNLDYRGFAGQVVSGEVAVGDEVVSLPSGFSSTVVSIDTYDGPLQTAFPPKGVVLRLADEIDVSRGDMLVKPADRPYVGRHFEADLVWMSETPLDPGRSYLVKHTTRYVRVNVDAIRWRLDLETFDHKEGVDQLDLNDIGRVRLTAHRPILFDPYETNRATGAFIVIDSVTNVTVGAGMIRAPEDDRAVTAPVELGLQSQVSPTERRRRLGHKGCVVWISGQPGAGRSELSYALERRLFDLGVSAFAFDRNDPRYSDSDLHGDPRRVSDVARRMADAGLVVVTAVDAPTIAERAAVRARIGAERFVEVHLRGGDDPDFEVPPSPDRTLETTTDDLDKVVEGAVEALRERGLIGG